MTSIDCRTYASIIREAVKEANHDDKLYRWNVTAINKSEAKFAWGYLGEGSKELFKLRIDADSVDDNKYVVVEIPYSTYNEWKFVTVADHRLADARTIEDGIKMVIKAASRYARNTF